MRKRTWIKGLFSLILLLALCGIAYGQERSLWEEYKSAFISGDGRVIDHFQDKISHSEGQGYGMLLALSYDDRNTFDKLWNWTSNNLAVRKDRLFAWQWGRRPTGRWEVMDYNNATDGDILIAYALLKAGKKWSNDAYIGKGKEIIEAIRKNLSFNWQGHTLLLPGYDGFMNDDTFVINPSYLIFPAFRTFAKFGDKIFWEKVYSGGLTVIKEARFGKLKLPADWIELGKTGMSPATGKSPYFGYGAVRILLYLSYEDAPSFPEGLKNLFNFYKKLGYIPLRIDLEREGLSLKDSSAGFYAIYALAAEKIEEGGLRKSLSRQAKEMLIDEKSYYFSFTLYLLATSEGVFN